MRRILTVAVVGSVAWLGIQMVQAQAGGEKNAVLRAASELKWVGAPDVKGVEQAVVWGDAKGAHGSFAKFASGTETPLHTHTATGRSVVVSGTIVSAPEGQKPKELGPGSYFSLPGGMKHTTTCKAGAECVIYSQWLGAFDFKPAEPGEKKQDRPFDQRS
jgi:quercetin dioxygenase-like cupin family protein